MTFALTAFGFIGTYTILLGGLLWKAAKFLSSVLKTGAKKTWKWVKGETAPDDAVQTGCLGGRIPEGRVPFSGSSRT